MKQLLLSGGILFLLVGCTTVESNNRLEQKVIREEKEVGSLASKVSTLELDVQKAELDYKERNRLA